VAGATASGGAGTGGNGGSSSAGAGGAGPEHVVGNCDGLGALDEWQDITPSEVDLSDNGIVEVLADPVHTGTIYTSGDKRGIFRSTDCGATWTKVNTGTNGTVLDSGTQWSMAIDPVDPEVLYAGNLYGSDPSLFKSTDGGENFEALFPPGSEVANTVEYNFTQEVAMDPTDHQHLVVSFHANCKGDYAPMCMAESKDSGESWRLFKGPTSGWVENARPLVLGSTTFLYATAGDGVYYTSDSGATWETLANIGGAGHQLYHAADGNYYVGTQWGVKRSADGYAWSSIDGAPNGDAMIGDGTRLFTGWPPCCGNTQPFSTASESDGTDWTTLPSPDLTGRRVVYFAYDPDHHVLYAALSKGGLLRMVTQ
jgi:hypothetical protein